MRRVRLSQFHRGKPAISRALSQFIRHSDIWGPNPTLVLSDDILKIRAEIRVTLMPPDGRKRKDTSDNALEVFRKRSRSMYDSEVGRDFVLVSSDGVERRVHQAILNSSSPVFSRMLKSNMKECKTGRCEIENVSGNTVDLLLRCMYYGSLKIPLA
ncbi:RvY_11847-1 [Ramazzottius varieornatus]|uniref:RvY_11847-1 protein ( RvY_11847.1protein, RvY_11847.2 protein ) n=1 Tax=Ramazzottius varieornatus TaxID=947166 RepID=A0A1D1VHI8_RAMVA|nr:RvY_11847-1 [Ramazzottius varieornatus]